MVVSRPPGSVVGRRPERRVGSRFRTLREVVRIGEHGRDLLRCPDRSLVMKLRPKLLVSYRAGDLDEETLGPVQAVRTIALVGPVINERRRRHLDLGALALLDGYYGQAVMTFAAAHERYC